MHVFLSLGTMHVQSCTSVIIYLFSWWFNGRRGIEDSKWHMTPKKNQAKSTKMQTDAADASKSKQKLRHWIQKLQINKKNKSWKSRIMHWRQTKTVRGRVMGSSWRRSIYFRKGRWVSGAGKASRVEGFLAGDVTPAQQCYTHSALWAGSPSRGHFSYKTEQIKTFSIGLVM